MTGPTSPDHRQNPQTTLIDPRNWPDSPWSGERTQASSAPGSTPTASEPTAYPGRASSRLSGRTASSRFASPPREMSGTDRGRGSASRKGTVHGCRDRLVGSRLRAVLGPTPRASAVRAGAGARSATARDRTCPSCSSRVPADAGRRQGRLRMNRSSGMVPRWRVDVQVQSIEVGLWKATHRGGTRKRSALFRSGRGLGDAVESLAADAAATLWRYMSFAKFCSLLEREALFFSLVGKMADRYEGFVYPPEPRTDGDQLRNAEGMARALLEKGWRKPPWSVAGRSQSTSRASCGKPTPEGRRSSSNELRGLAGVDPLGC